MKTALLWSAWLALAIVLGCPWRAVTVKSARVRICKLRYSDPLGAAEIAPILADFEEQYPWITVEVVEQPRSENEFMNQIAAGIDLVRLERGLGMAMMQQNLIRPLDDVQLTDWAAIRDDYYPPCGIRCASRANSGPSPPPSIRWSPLSIWIGPRRRAWSCPRSDGRCSRC